MTINSEIYKKIQASLQAARDTQHLKIKISKDINEVLTMISSLTDDAVSFEIKENDKSHPRYQSCSKIINIIKKSNPYYQFILCGYSINELNGYPVSVETEQTIYNCNDDEALKSTLADLIIEKETAVKIVNLISNEDMPF